MVIMVAIVVLVIVAGLGLRYWTSAQVAKTSTLILKALRHSRCPLNVSDLVQRTGRNSGFVINGLGFLQKHELVSSAEHSMAIDVAADKVHFSITHKGTRVLEGKERI